MKKYVAIGCTQGHDYNFFLPMVREAWKRVGYEPVFYLVGDWSKPHAQVTKARITNGDTVYREIESVDGIEDATIAQSIRLHAAASIMFKEDDLIIPSDADLIPVRREFYESHDLANYDIASYYSNGYIGEGEHFPSCHISATTKTWREFMGYGSKNPRDATVQTLEAFDIKEKMAKKKADPAKNWGWVWFADEHSVSAKIIASRFYPDRFQRIERQGHPPHDRLDRAGWPQHYNPATLTDCHSIRPGWCTSNWFRLRPLIEYLMPHSMWWVDQYRKDFLKAMGCDQ